VAESRFHYFTCTTSNNSSIENLVVNKSSVRLHTEILLLDELIKSDTLQQKMANIREIMGDKTNETVQSCPI
jgi:hypothetical protein